MVPPFTAVAVKATFVPAQIAVPGDVMETDTGSDVFTVIVMLLLVALTGNVHAWPVVITQEITSPFASTLELKVGLLAPVFTPFRFH